MSVYPLFLVLGSNGTIGAYASIDLLRIDLVQNGRDGHPARQVYKLNEHQLTVTYEPAPEFGDLTVPLQDLCPRHLREAMRTEKSAGICPNCRAEQSIKQEHSGC